MPKSILLAPTRLMFIFPKGESLIDNLYNRRNRPIGFYKKEVLPFVRQKLNLGDEVKFRWSQKAGCRCGCSPGFIVDGIYTRQDIFVTISDENEVDDRWNDYAF